MGGEDSGDAAVADVAAAEECVLEGEGIDRDGELATVETSVGTVRVLAPADIDRVQVSLRADAVRLHGPDGAPPAGGTSARNRLAGTVAHVRVAADGTESVTLVALVTLESVERLSLAPDAPMVATFKPTATRAVDAAVARHIRHATDPRV
ncbi:hypothetical protein DP107_13925 [Haloglomus irregulare]|uniref:Transport-associated OB type 1 domain-containing protein n=1 Tax=Haloglomus irregulare TaxID=2234134 RepID=A0A554MXA1_9EURY|nr:TOBE domain-containing protein [Haloglomus irregulare]TSD09757.1 hypothetical protein DP107_13925 [Haloglomus irregulare]